MTQLEALTCIAPYSDITSNTLNWLSKLDINKKFSYITEEQYGWFPGFAFLVLWFRNMVFDNPVQSMEKLPTIHFGLPAADIRIMDCYWLTDKVEEIGGSI